MSLLKIVIRTSLTLMIVSILSVKVLSQTAGTLTFSCSTYAPTGTWGNKHVLAVWIEDTQNPSNFIKTRAKYGHQDDHLTEWTAESGKNLVDAVTGATLTSYGTETALWDGTNVSSTVVPDGTYNVFIEMGWGRDKINQHAVMSFSFTKGENAVQLTPTGSSNYSDVSVEWKPAVTFSSDFNKRNPVTVFPNPSKGKVSLDFKNSIRLAKITVENESGISVYNNILKNNYSGILNIDLTPFANGLYFVKVLTPEKEYVYKVLVVK